MNLRSVGFWSRDLVLGRRSYYQLEDVRSLNSGTLEATERRGQLLDELLKYARSQVPFFRKLSKSSFDEWPILNKEIIRSRQSEMIADGADLSKAHVATTSGSTGTPFKIYQSREKRRRADVETIFLGQLAGYQFGSPLWFLRLWTGRNSYNRLSAFVRNLRPIDVSEFRQDDALDLLAEIDRTTSRVSIIALSSVLETIARAAQKDGLDSHSSVKINALIGQAEPLSQAAREVLWEKLGTYPVARYGMQEFGILAQQRPSRDETYHLNMASHVVELLKINSDERAAAGELGRVVVTDLFNRTQPLIRYDTGDLGVAGAFETGTGFVKSLQKLEGRSRERLYDVNDRPLPPMISYNFWWKFPELLEYQIVQRDRGIYTLRINVSPLFNEENELVNELKKVVGLRAQVEVEYCDSDFKRASGKRQAIVSEYVPPHMKTN